MSKALEAGVSYEEAAIAFGCNPQTMRWHYIALDEVAISDRVMDKIQGRNGEKNGEKHDAIPSSGRCFILGAETETAGWFNRIKGLNSPCCSNAGIALAAPVAVER